MNALSPAAWVLAHAARAPDAPAIDGPVLRFTYGELAARMTALAADLRLHGVSASDRVLVALPASPLPALAALAVHALGACVVEIDRAQAPEALAAIVAQARPRYAIVAAADAAKWARALERPAFDWIWTVGAPAGVPWPAAGVTALREDGALARDHHPRVGAAVEPAAGDPALVLYTSGSTGSPHGVVQTYGNVAANTRSIVEYLELGARDRVMAILPFHYCYGRSLLQTHLSVGGSVFVEPRFAFPRLVMQEIAAEGCTGFAGVPMTFEILRRELEPRDFGMDRLRYVTQAGGAMRAETTRWARAAFSPARLFVMYGQTEATARLAYLPPEDGERKAGAIGVPIPGVELRVVDDAGTELPAGAAGNLVARGENVTPGYLDAPEETAAILRDGWLWTGDLARRDEEGYFFLVGRSKEILKVSGHRVSPAELEDVIALHPAVAEVAVVGAEDAVEGEVPIAFVVLRAGAAATEHELRRHCRERLPLPKVPRRVEVVDAIPRGGSGKPLRARLAALARAGREGRGEA